VIIVWAIVTTDMFEVLHVNAKEAASHVFSRAARTPAIPTTTFLVNVPLIFSCTVSTRYSQLRLLT
jgi:hypothetical protein